MLADSASLAFDFLGFGLSDKPRDHRYSLFWQADLVEELDAPPLPEREVFLVAHDMGTSVATELMARDLDGESAFDLAARCCSTAASCSTGRQLTLAQRLLRSPLGPLSPRLSNERVFRQQFGALFSANHPLSDEEAADQWSLICHNGGRTLGHALIHYLGERVDLRRSLARRDPRLAASR